MGKAPAATRVRADLARPGAYPGPVEAVETLETHISYLFFAGDRVYKVKKPVDFGFLDFTTLEKRRHYCEEELRLNRRLAPRTYLEVAPVTEGSDGRLRMGGDGPPLDFAVVMERLPAHRMMARLLDDGRLDNSVLTALARLLVGFHEEARTGPGVDDHGGIETVRFNAEENFHQLLPFAGGSGMTAVCSRELLERLRRSAQEFLAQRSELFARRVAEGRIREGHGDLHCENICFLREEIVVFDCIEFSQRLRCCDVASDLAFLAMDLDLRGFRAFGDYLARHYSDLRGDRELKELLPFYKAYRALVRAKVAAFRSADGSLTTGERDAARREAQRYVQLAASYQLPKALLLTCGLPASGKSWAARVLSRACHAALLQSDQVRKRLAGMAPTDRCRDGFEAGIYSAEHTRATYDELAACATRDLERGRSVVVDASFVRAAQRASFLELGRARSIPVLIIEIGCPEQEIRRRMTLRAADPAEISDADWSVYLQSREQFEAPDEVPAPARLRFSGCGVAEELALAVSERLLAPG